MSDQNEKKSYSLVPYNGDFISKSNILISGKYRASLQTNRITYMNNLKLQTGNYTEDPVTHELCVQLYPNEITRMMNQEKGGSIYQALDGVARQLLGTYIGVTDEDNNRFRYINLITESIYENGVLTTKYNPHMKNYLLNLKQNFTKLPRDLMMSWPSTASYRLYELMKQRAYYPKNFTGTRTGCFTVTYDVYELRLLLGVVNSNLESVRRILDGTNPPDYKKACLASPEKIYEDWTSFRRRVIQKAVEEINGNEKSDIEINFKPLKKSHGEVYAVEFYIQLKNMNNTREDSLQEYDSTQTKTNTRSDISSQEKFLIQLESMNILKDYNIKPEEIVTICEAANYDLKRIETAEHILQTQSKIDNVVGWIIAAIKNEYNEPTSFKGKRKNKNIFSEFEQNEYDWNQLEEDLLNHPIN